jgi:hypothetical protein
MNDESRSEARDHITAHSSAQEHRSGREEENTVLDGVLLNRCSRIPDAVR